jgi:regulator of sigma E protease
MASVFALLGLAVLIVVHELGHMAVARLAGMRVDRFSIGFGPTLLRWRGRKTSYQVALIPLGGFVQIAGMNPQEQLPAGDPGSYANKSPAARFATILAGPLTNYVCAMLVMIGVALVWGLPHWQRTTVVAEVDKGRPAAAAGFRAGDVVQSIDAKAVTTTDEVVALITASKGRELRVAVLRGGATQVLRVRPRESDGVYTVGIMFGQKLAFAALPAGLALEYGATYPFKESQRALGGLKLLFTGKVSVKQVGGPVEILRQLKISFEESIAMALVFLAMLNVYLGLFNLMPIPALDGGRLVFLIFTMVTRRAVNARLENAIHTVGFVLLLGLILLITYRDLARILGG